MTWKAPDVARPGGSLTAPERELLQGYLSFYRATLLVKCAGLTAEQLAARPSPPSNLSLLGLIRHLTKVERIWFRIHFAPGDPAEPLFAPELGKDADFELIDPADAQAAYEGLIAEWRLSDEAAAGRSLDERFAFGGTESTLRMIYIHLIGEYARHCGHADLVREQLDGSTGA
ncbi:DinB family protein [Kribbella sandramycini]|uniref:DinB family protein n=1 Tax=Kribbella sandramycini TaxID=60450 RepID=A0A7Y4KUF0_9ACTN|nr:DinB family protein [Kribbella sandramycini]MBB6568675.1 putative damage-inducible protein DinB [Kribbella sandramycini]NOL38739.1 DinB family protein [Kribbella sandramycini]